MFTGIVEEVGKVKTITRKGPDARLKILCGQADQGLAIGDSVAVNGACLTVTGLNGTVAFDIVGNTLAKTNLKRLKAGDAVNLENAMKLGDKISGHMVAGHIDGERTVRNNMNTSKGWVMDIAAVSGDEKYLVSKGTVAVDGVSLTVGETYNDFFRIYLIPLTMEQTTLKSKKTGDHVNIEFDMMAKYAAKRGEGDITEETLRRTGFMD
ncbi:MAG: riboflavin synthase [Candidatus Omnitrophica bacterium]|nr:riboflavin synthase [Candidatus Omnitrophota bacterium]